MFSALDEALFRLEEDRSDAAVEEVRRYGDEMLRYLGRLERLVEVIDAQNGYLSTRVRELDGSLTAH